METHSRFEHIQRNPKTHAEHRREVFWQIILPLLIGVLLLLAALAGIIVSAVQPVSDVRRWADVSLLWLILPSLFFALLCLVALVGMVFLVSLILNKLPPLAAMVQLYFEVAREKVGQVSDRLVEPVIKINGFRAALRYIRSLGRRLKIEP
jgi:hypothetical protein